MTDNPEVEPTVAEAPEPEASEPSAEGTPAPEGEPEAPAPEVGADVRTPSADLAKPGDLGVQKTGDREADARALAVYPAAELRRYAQEVGVEPAKTKAETVQRILLWMYPPIRRGVVGDVVPQGIGVQPPPEVMSARVARIHGQE